MITCIAVDDEPLALELLVNYSSRLNDLEMKKTFTRTSEGMAYIKDFPVDLLFLDIQMPDILGTDFYRSLTDKIPVIFTTAYSNYAVEGFNLNAIDYLLKPITFERFTQAVGKARTQINHINSTRDNISGILTVRSGYKLIRLDISSIVYIEALDNYIKIYPTEGRPVITHTSMKSILKKLPAERFIRVHRSYIINLEKRITYSNRRLFAGKKIIPVGVSFEEKVKKLFVE